MNLIYFNLSTDIKDPSLSFTTNWLNKISKNYDNVFLITLKGDLQHLNPNIKAYKLYNQNSNKLIALFRFYNYLFRILSKHKIERCFSHMNPLFLSLTLGSLKILGIKTILWYTHPSVTLKLKLATYFSDRIITASKKSFPINTKKLTPVGHAIETSLFKKIDTNKKYVSCVGRISKSKKIDVLIGNIPATAYETFREILRNSWIFYISPEKVNYYVQSIEQVIDNPEKCYSPDSLGVKKTS